MGQRNGFAEKGAAAETEWLGLMMQKSQQTQQTQQSFPRKKTMMVMHHHHHHHDPLLASAGREACGVWDNSPASGGGLLFCNTSNPVSSCPTDLYPVGSDFVLPNSLQHHLPCSDHSLAFSSTGGMVNANVRVPFTSAQREELERQTMIYKYMDSSPAPPQLLLPISKFPNCKYFCFFLVKGSLELGISGSSDPEPWRCKRTDGKKWRCSRDVAFDLKYCERHAHKTRNRSRKPVESQTLNPNLLTTNNNNMRSPTSNFFRQSNITNRQSPYSSNMVPSAAAAAGSHVQPRSLAWFMNGEAPAVGGSNQEWGQMMQFKLGLKSSSHNYTKPTNTDVDVPRQQTESSLNLHTDYRGEIQGLQIQQTRHFIDAWSTSTSAEREEDRVFVSPNQKLPFSSLTLSMSGGEGSNEERENTQMGLGVLGEERESVGGLKSQWMNPMSWMMGSPPGGPLAEALCLGIAGGSNGCNSGSTICKSSSGDARQEFDLTN
ncbi:growth-regulating factor 8 [Pyrus ussuriensis x Pyrus communis]|uniref:Growth-regulating factor n=1 Tax=Pyrus ussuriensis x Pyrus communis TaxID=2448454 RepID=A0A5N5H039_9ROSA|nr:growth-regulating factor 8 [Pyrus ussuriensis x Pyrus communis]